MHVVVALLGLGEAGSAIATDLVAAGATVRGYDPRVRSAGPAGVRLLAGESSAVTGAHLVLSANSAHDARDAAAAAAPGLGEQAVFADLNTTSARAKQEIAGVLPPGRFADVALMSPVPGRGLRTPMLAAGDGAARYAQLLTPLGAQVTVLDGPAGDAATRKLLRSVFYKGMAAAAVEALTAAEKAGLRDWLERHLTQELEAADASTLGRLVAGSRQHALRRSHEMDAATALLRDLGVPARIAPASRDLLAGLAGHEPPDHP
ncbi:NAD(P)-dependent oxidoreductase [Kineosporia sp. J2-2]|uniref:NAD(P)-dependent oxidoreductase n=1 Tax=Kineosporia corallincola TaxID=2835133 RepID=A0ABS5TDJ7_9ACTN|nr:NAD(P)-dependent oxidoreductase [Kineosporia corallincola]MBT0768281.1 NAD(P)-dependent oxidoreductase [Kineosporia corallincola]